MFTVWLGEIQVIVDCATLMLLTVPFTFPTLQTTAKFENKYSFYRIKKRKEQKKKFLPAAVVTWDKTPPTEITIAVPPTGVVAIEELGEMPWNVVVKV